MWTKMVDTSNLNETETAYVLAVRERALETDACEGDVEGMIEEGLEYGWTVEHTLACIEEGL